MLIIDRFEGAFAVCEDGAEQMRLPREALPAAAREGDVLAILESGAYAVDEAATKARREAARRRFAALLSVEKQ